MSRHEVHSMNTYTP